MTSTFNRQKNVEQFEDIINELKSIQKKIDILLFDSVFLRKPIGCSDENIFDPSDEKLNLADTINEINNTINRLNELEDQLKEQLDNENNNAYEDQIEDYLRDLKELCKTLKTLKPILTPENLRDGEPGKTDVSWLYWHKSIMVSKLHKEMLELQDIDPEIDDLSKLQNYLKTLSILIQTANTLLKSSQYLSWFTRCVINYNESLPEFNRDFTVNLVAQWVQEEASKVLEHHKNCLNLHSEIESKLEAKNKQ